MPEFALDQRQRDPLVQQLDRVRMAQLVLVPTSAQAPLSRPARYGDLVRKSLHVGIYDVGITRAVVVILPGRFPEKEE